MRSLVTFFLCVIYTSAFACDCAYLGELNKAEIEKTDYIALVRIKQFLPVKIDSAKYQMDPFFKIIVDEVIHYKGSRLKEIVVSGGHPVIKMMTSCDFGMMENQEWVIFGDEYAGNTFVYPCGRTTIYREANGFRNWQMETGIKEIRLLDSMFNKIFAAPAHADGEIKTYFPGGKVEKIEHYKNGKLHGKVQHFFADGALNGKVPYSNGVRNGVMTWYYHSGAIEKRTKFKNGIAIDTSVYYINNGKISQPHYLSVYNRKGELTLFREYTGPPGKRYIETETVYQPKLKKETIRNFYPNGKVRFLQYRISSKDVGDYFEYDDKGNIIGHYKFDEKGDLIKQKVGLNK